MNTKAIYKTKIKELSKKEIEREVDDLSLQLAKAKVLMQQGQNPYYGKADANGKKSASGINVKLVRWKLQQLKIYLKNEKAKTIAKN